MKKGGVGGKLAPKSKKPRAVEYQLPDVANLPKDLGTCIQLFAAAHRERKRREEHANSIKTVEDQLESHIIDLFTAEDINKVGGSQGTVTLKEKDVPRITDYEALCKHIKKNDAWDLLQRRPGEVACQSRWEAGEEIPGVEKFHVKKLALTETK